MLREHEIEIRVRYFETDAQGYVHHANYLVWFEQGRTELLRAAGRDYEQLEAEGLLLVVSEMSCRYHLPCRFGETVRVSTRTERARGARAVHVYRVHRGDELLAEGRSTIACIDREGNVRRLPEWLLTGRDSTDRST